MKPVRVGSFLLMDQVAEAPTGQVWRCIHPDRKLTVAMKVLPGDWNDKGRKVFRAEMRSLATLDHDHVMHLFDYGEVIGQAATSLGVKQRTPYFVTEHASGGSAARRRWTWQWLRQTLLEVLEGLAHAHSRGHFHRGLKPENILFCTVKDIRPGIRIGDFGVSDLRRRINAPIGDEGYLAPEQVQRGWRSFGPWTDLFSVGAVAYRLASGLRPFETTPHASPVPLTARFPVPEGFADWVHRLLQWEPQDRYQRAADAAWALHRLGGAVLMPTSRVGPTISPKGEMDEFPAEDEITEFRTPLQQSLEADEEATGTLFLPVGVAAGEVPPMPSSWRRQASSEVSLPVTDVGLRLFGLRQAPLIGRARERDAIWSALGVVGQTQSPAGILIRGTSGSGRTRLVHWMSQRAHELGAAEVLSARVGPHDVPGEAIRRMLASALRTNRLPPERVEARVRGYLQHLGPVDDLMVNRLVRELTPRRAGSTDPHLETSADRISTLVQFMGKMASFRPVILTIFDAHWDLDALAVAEAVLRANAPVLVLMTVRSEELASHPDEATRLGEMQTAGLVTALPVGPLPAADHEALVERLIGHQGVLSHQVAEITAGDVRFAVELVADWVEQGFLVVGGSGFMLKSETPKPRSVRELWGDRLARVLSELHPDAIRMLDIAAALGLRVDEEEWQEACDHVDAESENLREGRVALRRDAARTRYALVEALLQARLAHDTALGFGFVDRPLTEHIAEASREGGRWRSAHLSVARMLERRAEHGQAGARERQGLHLLSAGEGARALRPLMQGVEERISASGYRPAMSLLSTFARCLRDLALPADDERYGELWLTRARLSFLKGDYDAAYRWATRVVDTGTKSGWEEVVLRARFQRAQVGLRRSDLDAAVDDLLALKNASEDGTEAMGRAMFGLAAVSRYRNDFDEAFVAYGEACRHFQASNHEAGAASCWRDMAALELALDRLDRAETLYERAHTTYEALGKRHEMANCVNGLAEVARARGDLDGAERGYKHAIELFEAIGGGQIVIPRMNLALISLQRGDYAEARKVFDQARLRMGQQGRVRLIACAHLGLAASAAGLGRFDAFDGHVREAEKTRERTQLADPDCGWTAELAGKLALRRGEAERAARAWRFAVTQFDGLEDAAKAAKLRARLDALSEADDITLDG
jgi:eukaryotic-like serine/threonine-protein kinase